MCCLKNERTCASAFAHRYLPYLTDADLAEDSPDHQSGYVAVIGKPNAGAFGTVFCARISSCSAQSVDS